MNFDFFGLADLNLSIAECYSINKLWEKQKVNQDFWQETPQEFLTNYIRCSRSAIPCNAVPSVVMAQGILESGWFSTNSLFGVKATKLQTQEGIGTPLQTHEIVGGLSVPTVGTFFVNPSVQNCFANLYDYIARMKPQSTQFLPADCHGFINYLQEPLAYSTAGHAYINSVLATIESNGLVAFDHI